MKLEPEKIKVIKNKQGNPRKVYSHEEKLFFMFCQGYF